MDHDPRWVPEIFMRQVVIQDEMGPSLILRPNSRVCNGSTMAHPLLRNLSREGDGLYLLGWSGHFLSRISGGRSQDKWFILCRRTKAAASGDCEEMKREVDWRCFALAR